jgi:hypothetical protein
VRGHSAPGVFGGGQEKENGLEQARWGCLQCLCALQYSSSMREKHWNSGSVALFTRALWDTDIYARSVVSVEHSLDAAECWSGRHTSMHACMHTCSSLPRPCTAGRQTCAGSKFRMATSRQRRLQI